MIALERLPVDQGQQVVLGISHGTEVRWFRSRVAGRESDLVWLDAPVENGNPIIPHAGADVVVHTWRSTDAYYTLHSELLAIDDSDPPRLGLRVRETERVQRREYFRVEVSLDTEGSVVIESEHGEQSVELSLRDLSTSGMRALSTVLLLGGEELRVKLPLPGESGSFDLRAKVIRIIADIEQSPYACHFGAQFIDVPPGVRERMIRFTLGVQQERLRLGQV